MKRGNLSGRDFDVVIVGAGIVGCAMARRFALEGAHVAVVEKAGDILDGASKANSAILHTGFDAPPDSMELSCVIEGAREYRDIHEQMGLALERVGAHVVAWSEEQVAALEAIGDKARQNAIEDIELIGAKQLGAVEPHLSTKAMAAIFVPGESIIDPWSAPYAYLHQALDHGAEIFLQSELLDGAFGADGWHLETSTGSLKCRHVINCAGLYGDLLDKKLLGRAD